MNWHFNADCSFQEMSRQKNPNNKIFGENPSKKLIN